MANPVLPAAVLCILPAGAVLLLLGRRYEGYFDDRRLFFSLVVGFFAGIVVASLERIAFRFHEPALLLEGGTAILLVAGYGLVESLGKVVVLGAKGFRTRKDTPFYGAALGAGFGAMLAIQFLAADLFRLGVVGELGFGQAVRVGLAPTLMAWGTVLGAAGVGGRLGKLVTDGKLRKAPFLGMLWQAPLPALLGLLGLSYHYRVPGWQVVLVGLAALGYGILLCVLTFRLLDGIVPPEIRDMVRRDRRRQVRKEARGG